MPPVLIALTEGPDIPLNKPIILIGRHEECDVLIPSRKISRRHCCVAQVSDYVVVKDLFSTNGVRINGVRVKEGALHTGDELTIGNYRYKIQLNPELESPLSRSPAAQQGMASDQMESCELPVALRDDPQLGPVPQGRPLVLPVNGQPPPVEDPYDKIQLAPSDGDLRMPVAK